MVCPNAGNRYLFSLHVSACKRTAMLIPGSKEQKEVSNNLIISIMSNCLCPFHLPIQYIYSENFNYGNQQYLGLTQTPTICSGECLSIDQTKVYLFFQKQPDILGNQVHSMNTIDYPSFIKIPISLKEL